ncbi:ankyrin repeat domain-containing protein [Streptomycetaceae bacterium NBC_01309]
MSFFDGLVAPQPPEPETPQVQEVRLVRYAPPDGNEEHAPEHFFVPATVEQIVEVGRGGDMRVLLNGWTVWRHSATLRLGVYLRRIPAEGGPSLYRMGRPRAGDLRCGLRLADGRRVTTLDGQPWPAPEGPPRPTLSLRPQTSRGHHLEFELHLSQLPPAGELVLVIEWPDQGIPETATALDAAAVRAAAERAYEVWPDLDPPRPPESGAPIGYSIISSSDGAARIMAPRPASQPWRPPVPPPPAADRGDWEEMGRDGITDLDVVRARLARGADPNQAPPGGGTILHDAAERAPVEVVAELLAHGAVVDAVDEGHETPLWRAVCHGKAENAAALLAAGAQPWAPVVAGRSAGRLALRTGLAPLFEDLPGYAPLTEAERAEQRDADERAEVFRGMYTEGLSVAFVAGIDEEEAVRRLGSTPEASPVLDLAADPGPHGTGPGGFDPHDWDTSERFLGVRAVPGGCVVVQPMGYRASTPTILSALSPETKAYGLYFNPKGGTFGHYSEDGVRTLDEEIGLSAHEESPDRHWLYRFWDWDRKEGMWAAYELAYASAMGGVRIATADSVVGPPNRWVELPQGSPLLQW